MDKDISPEDELLQQPLSCGVDGGNNDDQYDTERIQYSGEMILSFGVTFRYCPQTQIFNLLI